MDACMHPGYVALGDSYTSGTGTGVGAVGPCGRSALAYGSLYASRNPGLPYANAACAGATSAHLRLRQTEHVDATTNLVTLTAGGNDGAAFWSMASLCAPCQDPAGCRMALDNALAYAETVLPRDLEAAFRAVRRAAPHATVVALGYPEVFEHDDPTGSHGRFNRFCRAVSACVARCAELTGVLYAPVDFTGHRVGSADPWINGHGSEAVSGRHGDWHPNAAGHRHGYLPALEAVIG